MKTSLIRKVFCAAVAAFAVAFTYAEPTRGSSGASNGSLYTVDSASGRIWINENLSAFSFDMSGINAGESVQYVVYRHIESAGDLEAREPTTGSVALGGTTRFSELHEGDSIAFTLNSSVESTAFLVSDSDYVVKFGEGGTGGGTPTISNIKASRGSKSGAPSGQPLPGLLAVLLVGGAGAGALKLRKRRG